MFYALSLTELCYILVSYQNRYANSSCPYHTGIILERSDFKETLTNVRVWAIIDEAIAKSSI